MVRRLNWTTAVNLLITSVKRRSFLILLGSHTPFLQRTFWETKFRFFLILLLLLLCHTYALLAPGPGDTKLDGGCQPPIPAFLILLLLCSRKSCARGPQLRHSRTAPWDRRRGATEGDNRSFVLRARTGIRTFLHGPWTGRAVGVATEVHLYQTMRRLKNSCPF